MFWVFGHSDGNDFVSDRREETATKIESKINENRDNNGERVNERMENVCRWPRGMRSCKRSCLCIIYCSGNFPFEISIVSCLKSAFSSNVLVNGVGVAEVKKTQWKFAFSKEIFAEKTTRTCSENEIKWQELSVIKISSELVDTHNESLSSKGRRRWQWFASPNFSFACFIEIFFSMC